jgi:hypothetical protein
MSQALSLPEWFTAVDQQLFEEALQEHAPLEYRVRVVDFTPGPLPPTEYRYATDAAALAAVLAVCEVLAPIVREHDRDTDDPSVIRLRDAVIARVEGERAPPHLDLRQFRQFVRDALETRTWWQPVPAPVVPTSPTPGVPSMAKQLQDYREEAGLSEEALADQMGIDRRNVQEHLYGERIPNYKTQKRYEDLFTSLLGREVKLKRKQKIRKRRRKIAKTIRRKTRNKNTR